MPLLLGCWPYCAGWVFYWLKEFEMNERIKELALQARNYALDEKRIYERMHNTEQCMEEYREVYNKKFAELIVKECAKEAFKYTWNRENYDHYSDVGWDCLPGDLQSHIEEHFGVSE
jgi:hypothetical protein